MTIDDLVDKKLQCMEYFTIRKNSSMGFANSYYILLNGYFFGSVTKITKEAIYYRASVFNNTVTGSIPFSQIKIHN